MTQEGDEKVQKRPGKVGRVEITAEGSTFTQLFEVSKIAVCIRFSWSRSTHRCTQNFAAGKEWIAVSNKKKLTLYHVATKVTRVFRHPREVTALAFHPTEDYLITGEVNGSISRWQSLSVHERDEPIATNYHWHAHACHAVAFTPDGAYVLSGGEEVRSTLLILLPRRRCHHLLHPFELFIVLRRVSIHSVCHLLRLTHTLVCVGRMATGDRQEDLRSAHRPRTDHQHLCRKRLLCLRRFSARQRHPHYQRIFYEAGSADSGHQQRCARSKPYHSDLVTHLPLSALLPIDWRPLVGFVQDPRTNCIVTNTYPGFASLQVYDVLRDAHVGDFEVEPQSVAIKVR